MTTEEQSYIGGFETKSIPVSNGPSHAQLMQIAMNVIGPMTARDSDLMILVTAQNSAGRDVVLSLAPYAFEVLEQSSTLCMKCTMTTWGDHYENLLKELLPDGYTSESLPWADLTYDPRDRTGELSFFCTSLVRDEATS